MSETTRATVRHGIMGVMLQPRFDCFGLCVWQWHTPLLRAASRCIRCESGLFLWQELWLANNV